MRIADLLKPGTVTIITDSPEHAAAWGADLADEPDVAVVLCEDTPENCNINTCNRPPGVRCSECIAEYLESHRPDEEVESATAESAVAEIAALSGRADGATS